LMDAEQRAAQEAAAARARAGERDVAVQQVEAVKKEHLEKLERHLHQQALGHWEQRQRLHPGNRGRNLGERDTFKACFNAFRGDPEAQATSMLEAKRARPPSPIRRPPAQHLFAPPPPRPPSPQRTQQSMQHDMQQQQHLYQHNMQQHNMHQHNIHQPNMEHGERIAQYHNMERSSSPTMQRSGSPTMQKQLNAWSQHSTERSLSPQQRIAQAVGSDGSMSPRSGSMSPRSPQTPVHQERSQSPTLVERGPGTAQKREQQEMSFMHRPASPFREHYLASAMNGPVSARSVSPSLRAMQMAQTGMQGGWVVGSPCGSPHSSPPRFRQAVAAGGWASPGSHW